MQAEKKLFEKNLDKEYAGIMGYEAFRKCAVELALGKDSAAVKDKLVRFYPYVFLAAHPRCLPFPHKYVTAQAVSGTGALRLAGMFLVSCSIHFFVCLVLILLWHAEKFLPLQ